MFRSSAGRRTKKKLIKRYKMHQRLKPRGTGRVGMRCRKIKDHSLSLVIYLRQEKPLGLETCFLIHHIILS